MIVCGTRKTHLVSIKVDTKCKKCGRDHTIRLHIFQKYAHLLWIPLFPISKIPMTECNYCKKVTRKEKFSSNMYHFYQKSKRRIKTPIWTYIGSALLIILMTTLIFWNQIRKKRELTNDMTASKLGNPIRWKVIEK